MRHVTNPHEGIHRPLHVVQAALNFVPGGMGGTETYATELNRELLGRHGVELSSVVPGNAGGVLPTSDERALSFVRAGESTRARLGALLGSTLGAARIRRAMSDADVVHYPFTALVPPPPHGTPFVVTVHDLQHLTLPEMFSRAEHVYRERYYHRGIRRATLVITISEFAKRTIVEELGIPDRLIRVISHGVDHSRFKVGGERDDFLFYPARGWPHKNHQRLFRAIELLRRERPHLRLVLSGGGDRDVLGALPEWVEHRGLVSDRELNALYRSAAALVYPSLYEGFGLPLIEAMASGCPVAASNAGSIPEVCGDAAVLFDPTDVSAIAGGIRQALNRASELTALGLERASSYTWAQSAAKHEAAFREACA